MAQGRSNRAIGEHLAVEIKTVETHVGRVFTKLGQGSLVRVVTGIARRHDLHQPHGIGIGISHHKVPSLSKTATRS